MSSRLIRPSNVKRASWQFVILFLILIVAAVFRFYGIAWDSGYLFHPDERKIVLVANDLALPTSPLEFFSPDNPLNPKFFAYGSFPIYLLRALSAFAPPTDFAVPWRDNRLVGMALLGRALSSLFDLGTIAFTFLLARRLYDARIGLMAAACLAVTVLDIQLAHFYAVDTLLTMLIVATMFFAARFAQDKRMRDFWIMSIVFGLALATKITALPLSVPIVVVIVCACGKSNSQVSVSPRDFVKNLFDQIWDVRQTIARVLAIAFAVFIITQPYALLDPIRFFGQVGTELFVARGWLDYPYTRQYADTLPFIYQIVQSSIWGMSLPLGIFAWLGSALFVWQWWRMRDWRDGFLLAWSLVYFFSIGAQYAKYLRYLLPLTPFLFLMATLVLTRFIAHASRITRYATRAAFSLVLVFAFLYSIAFTSIYGREHPWLEISKWIYKNIPTNSVIIVEHWDELMPASLRLGEPRSPTEYQLNMLPLFDADTSDKRDAIINALASSDYIILASQRLYATIPRLPARYPMTTRYYHALFDGSLGFDLVAHSINAPALDGVIILPDTFSQVGLRPPIRSDALASNWGFADESFTVYDHPMPLVFKKTRPLSGDELRALLSP
jgi:hypothetical protein